MRDYQTVYLILLVIILCFSTSVTKSQNAVISTGHDLSGNGGKISYSVGQVSYSIISGINGNIVEGVQQPYEISVFTKVDNIEGITLDCTVYPNPTTDILHLKFRNYSFNKSINYFLLSSDGELIKKGIVKNDDTSISINDIVSSTYFLQVFIDQINVKTFKIIKH